MTPRTARGARRARRGAGVAAAALWLALAACSGKQQPPPKAGSGSAEEPVREPAPAKDTRPELERRRAAACERLGPRLAHCAVEDARARLAAGKITEKQFREDTKPEIARALAEDWRKKCSDGYMSSRQVRVLEVCYREETACAPLEACLGNLKPVAK